MYKKNWQKSEKKNLKGQKKNGLYQLSPLQTPFLP